MLGPSFFLGTYYIISHLHELYMTLKFVCRRLGSDFCHLLSTPLPAHTSLLVGHIQWPVTVVLYPTHVNTLNYWKLSLWVVTVQSDVCLICLKYKLLCRPEAYPGFFFLSRGCFYIASRSWFRASLKTSRGGGGSDTGDVRFFTQKRVFEHPNHPLGTPMMSALYEYHKELQQIVILI